jgi:serine/threonine protein phosphatase PrpC
MQFKVAHDSRVGRRRNNQDRFSWGQSDDAVFMVVADGMGGHRLGEVAAHIVVDQFAQIFEREARPRLDDPARFLYRNMLMAHEAINDYASMRAIPIADAPRTTCVACVIQGGRVTWAHVGDSRFYFVRNRNLLTRTLDHSRVQAMLDAGEITAAQAEVHPHRNLVTTCLGGDQAPRIDLSPTRELLPGDTIALCSDGIWAHLAEILPVALSRPIDQAVKHIMDQAEQVNGPTGDNLTLLALRWESGNADEPAFASTRPDASTRPFDPSQTVIQNLRPATKQHPELSDSEIANAIESIRTKLKRNRPPETAK